MTRLAAILRWLTVVFALLVALASAGAFTAAVLLVVPLLVLAIGFVARGALGPGFAVVAACWLALLLSPLHKVLVDSAGEPGATFALALYGVSALLSVGVLVAAIRVAKAVSAAR